MNPESSGFIRTIRRRRRLRGDSICTNGCLTTHPWEKLTPRRFLVHHPRPRTLNVPPIRRDTTETAGTCSSSFAKPLMGIRCVQSTPQHRVEIDPRTTLFGESRLGLTDSEERPLHLRFSVAHTKNKTKNQNKAKLNPFAAAGMTSPGRRRLLVL